MAKVHQSLEKILSDDEMAVVDDIIAKFKSANQEVENLEQKIADTNEQIHLMRIKREKETADAIIEENANLLKELQALRAEDLRMMMSEQEIEDLDIIESINHQFELIHKAYEKGLIDKEKYDEYILFANDAHKVQM